jgi:hypothetical protein
VEELFMSWKSVALAAACVTMVGGQALAQSAQLPTLGDLRGTVFVDQGDGYLPVDRGTVLHPGDRVIAGRGGVARLAYADGCTSQVTSRTLATVSAVSPCAGGTAPRVIKAADDAGYAGGGGGISTTGWIIGGLAVIGIVAVIVSVATDNGSNSP